MRRTTVQLCFSLLALSNCVMNRFEPGKKSILLRQDVAGLPNRIDVEPGYACHSLMKEGHLLETLYVSGADFKKKHGGKEKLGEKFYRDNFPVWSSKSEKAGKILPSKKIHIRICLEINKFGDTNQAFPAKEGDWDGKPALLYSVTTDGLKDAKSQEFPLVGRSGKEGKALGDFQGMDSALRMIKSASLTVTEK